MYLRPLEFKPTGDRDILGMLEEGDYFRFNRAKTVYRLDGFKDGDILYSTYFKDFKSDYKQRAHARIERMQPIKPKVLVSFSAGETSAFMLKWLKDNKSEEWDIIYVFANTGEESEETLIFADRVGREFNVHIVWVEADVLPEKGQGIRHKLTNFENACRDVSIFEKMVTKYGLFNHANPNCTKYLKAEPIKDYARSKGWGRNYYTAIGIRSDEIDRMSVNRKKDKIIYPLIMAKPMTKQHINAFWRFQDFRLNLKGYQGNCKACFKKSDKKLIIIARETPEAFNNTIYLEDKFGHYVTEGRDASKWTFPITMYRSHKSGRWFLQEAQKNPNLYVDDDNQIYPDDEACEIYSHCGADN